MFSITQEKQCSISSRQVDGWDGMEWNGMDGWIEFVRNKTSERQSCKRTTKRHQTTLWKTSIKLVSLQYLL